MHILFLSSWYPTKEQPFLGNFVKRHAELIARNHRVTVLTLQSTEQKPITSTVISGNLTEIFVQYSHSSNPLIKWRNARKSFKDSLEAIKDIDLIHGNIVLSKGLQFVWAKKYLRKPLVVTEHASYFQKPISKNWSWLEKYILQKVMKSADVVTAVSPFLKEEMLAHFPEKAIKILPNVIDPEIFNFKPKTKGDITRFIHVSTLDERYKNVRGILNACKILKESRENTFVMDIISDEPYQDLEAHVRSMGLSECVRFSGPSKPMEIALAIQHSDALVLFSHYETFSIVIAEAWATGTPVISTPVGIAKNLDCRVGLQVEDGNVEQLKEAMLTIMENKTKFEVESIRKAAQNFFPDEISERINEIYHSFI